VKSGLHCNVERRPIASLFGARNEDTVGGGKYRLRGGNHEPAKSTANLRRLCDSVVVGRCVSDWTAPAAERRRSPRNDRGRPSPGVSSVNLGTTRCLSTHATRHKLIAMRPPHLRITFSSRTQPRTVANWHFSLPNKLKLWLFNII